MCNLDEEMGANRTPRRMSTPFAGMKRSFRRRYINRIKLKPCKLRTAVFVRVATYNLSVIVALIVQFTTNGMCAMNSTHMYVARASHCRAIASRDLYFRLLPQ